MNGDIEKIKTAQREIEKTVQALTGAKQNSAGYEPVFDGAFDPEKYVKSPVKILFIGKEPGFPGDGGWDYGGTPACTETTPALRRGSPPDKNDLYRFMNAVANGILNNDFSTPRNLDDNAPLYNTALINVSNLPGEAHAGIDGNMSRLYDGNREILEKKLNVYTPGVTVCFNTAEVIWDSLQTQLAFDAYRTKYFDADGKEIALDKNNEPAEAPAAAVYYCDNGKIIIDVYRANYQIRDGFPAESWIAGAVNSFRPARKPVPAPVIVEKTAEKTVEKTPENKNSGTKKKKPFFLIPVIIAAAIILLLLSLLRFCKTPDETPAAAVTTEPAKTAEIPPLPPPAPPSVPVFSEMTEVVFAKDSAALLPSAAIWLDRLAGEMTRQIEQNPSASFRITGYTAVFPGLPDPALLSLERAAAITKELSRRGIAPDKLEAVGGGETDKWGGNTDEESRRPNRRIVIEQL